MSVACSSPPLLSSSCSTATLDAQCSLSDLNHDHPRPVFPAGPQPRPSPPSVPCRTSTTTIHAQCSLPDLNREYPRQVFPAGPHVGRYGTKNVQKKVRKNVRQVCYILLANSRVCGRVTGAMPLLTLQVAKFEAISLNRWQSHWGGQRHFHFCTFGAVCKDAWDRQHLTASYYKLLEVISCWIDAWDSQHHTGFLLCITAMVAWWICDIGTGMVLSSLHTSLRAFDFGSGGPLACFSHVFTNMFDRRCADMFGMFVCLAQVVHWPVWSCLSKPVESSGVYFTWPTDMFISCLTDWHAQWPARWNKWLG